MNSFSELAQCHGLKAVLTCVGQPVSSLPSDWDPGCEAPSTHPELWAGFNDLVASWQARSSRLIAPLVDRTTTPDPKPRRYTLLTTEELSAMPLAKYRVKNVLHAKAWPLSLVPRVLPNRFWRLTWPLPFPMAANGMAIELSNATFFIFVSKARAA